MNNKYSVKDFFLVPMTNEKEVLKTLFKIIIKKEKPIIQNETFKSSLTTPDSIEINRLMNDNEMGELFKVIALAPKNFPSLEGFTCGTRTNIE